jgi:hypothetical protein
MTEEIDFLVSDFEGATKEIEKIIADLDQRQSWLDQARQEWPGRTTEEKEAFQEAAEELRVDLDTQEFDGDVLNSFFDELQRSYRSPLLDSIRSNIEKVCSKLGIDSVVEERDVELSDRFEDDLVETRSQYQKIANELDDCDGVVLRKIATEYQDDPFLVLNPNRVRQDINKYNQIYSGLRNIFSQLHTREWSPDEISQLSNELTRLESPAQTWDEIKSIVSRIEEQVEELDSFDLNSESAVSGSLSTKIYSEDQRTHDALREASSELSDVIDYQELLTKVDAVLDRHPDALGETEFGDDRHLETNYNTITELEGDLSRLERNFDQWKDHLHQRWSQIRSVGDYYLSGFEEIDIIASDEIVAAIDSGIPIDEDPSEAFDLLQQTEQWLTEQESELQDELSEEAITFLNDLINHEEVVVSDYSAEAIAQISDQLRLTVRIDEE